MGSVPRDHNAVGNGNAVDAIVPKAEPAHEGSSSSVSTPDAEGEPLVQDAAPTQKRKGGRKPVCSKSIGIIIKEKKKLYIIPRGHPCYSRLAKFLRFRYMPPPKNVNRGTGKPRLPSANAEPNT